MKMMLKDYGLGLLTLSASDLDEDLDVYGWRRRCGRGRG
jgi:hypothetical protein